MSSDDVVYEDESGDWDDDDSDDDHDDDYNNESESDDDEEEFEDEDEDEENDNDGDYNKEDESLNDDDENDNEEEEEDDEETTKVSMFCVILMCFCCCIILGIAGALIGVYVFDDFGGNNKKGNEDKNKPTTTEETPSISFAPTNIPSNQPSISIQPTDSLLPSILPSNQPTISFAPSDFIPEFFEFPASQDNTITNSDPTGQTDVSYGSNEVLIVFKGPNSDNGRSDASAGLEVTETETTTTAITEESFSLIAFNISGLPSLDNAIYVNRQTSAILKLQHIPRPGSGPVNMTISLLDNIDANSIEDMTYDSWILFDSIDDVVILGRTYFNVLPDQIYVNIDVTDILLFNTIMRRRRSLRRRIRRRKLEPLEEDNDDDDDSYSFLVFQITRTTTTDSDNAAANDEEIEGDPTTLTTTELPNRFHSRESTTSPPPILEIQLTIPSENPTISIQPTTAEGNLIAPPISPTTSPTTTTIISNNNTNTTTSN